MAMSVYGSASSQNGRSHASQSNETGKAPRPQNGLPRKKRLALESHPRPWVRGAVGARTTRVTIKEPAKPRQCQVVRTVSLEMVWGSASLHARGNGWRAVRVSFKICFSESTCLIGAMAIPDLTDIHYDEYWYWDTGGFADGVEGFI